MKLIGMNLALMAVVCFIITLVLYNAGYDSTTDNICVGMFVGVLFGILNLSPVKFDDK